MSTGEQGRTTTTGPTPPLDLNLPGPVLSTADEGVVPPVDLGPIGPKSRYEFTKPQEAVIGDLASKMRFVGAFLFTLAIFGILQGAFFLAESGGTRFDVLGFINVLIFGMIGYWTMSAARDFTAVVETEGWDVPHLMDALRSLRKMYTLLFTLLIAAILASVVLMTAFRMRPKV